ncbi:MAG: hypothetical protein KDD94_05305 [Calditrichaeota bacterium]|nr:hypothetical protein [Calditrichota bacterium]
MILFLKKLPPIFFLAVILALINHFFFKQFLFLKNLEYYLNDFLFPMIFIPAIFLIRQQLNLTKLTKPDFFFIFAFCVVFSIWFELILPIFQPLSTGDSYDVLAYFLGGITLHISSKFSKPAI